MRLPLLLLPLLGACGEAADAPNPVPEPSAPPLVQQGGVDAPPPPETASSPWMLAKENGGIALRLTDAAGKSLIELACRGGQLQVHVPAFERIGSEDRFMLGLGEEPTTLVADLSDPRPGISASGAVPPDFGSLLEKAKTLSVLYGTQQIGPHPAPPEALRDELTESCT